MPISPAAIGAFLIFSAASLVMTRYGSVVRMQFPGVRLASLDGTMGCLSESLGRFSDLPVQCGICNDAVLGHRLNRSGLQQRVLDAPPGRLEQEVRDARLGRPHADSLKEAEAASWRHVPA